MNLIVTCQRHMEEEAANEIADILEEMGDDTPNIDITDMSGILTVDTILEPVSISNKIKNMLIDEPWTIRYCMRVIPIQATVNAEIDAIADIAIKTAQQKIPKDSTYRITVEKRNSDIASSDIIDTIAHSIKNKVSLEYADFIILIEILHRVAGVSILQDSDIFSAEKTRRNMN